MNCIGEIKSKRIARRKLEEEDGFEKPYTLKFNTSMCAKYKNKQRL